MFVPKYFHIHPPAVYNIGMKQIRFSGIVRLADGLRHELVSPLIPARWDVLKKTARDAVAYIDKTLRDHQLPVDSLARPTHRAYEYLKTVETRQPGLTDTPPPQPPKTVHTILRFPGMKRFMEGILDTLSDATDPAKVDRAFQLIGQCSRNLEQSLVEQNLQAENLSPDTRTFRGWLAFFARRDRFDGYVQAVRTAKAIFEAALTRSGKGVPPVLLHFRPARHLYRIRRFRDGTQIHLPTPMVRFNAEQFQTLADLILGLHKDKRPILDALRGSPCLALQSEIEELSGTVEKPRGHVHDLGASFDRVNTAYFDGQLSRPRLAWSRKPTYRKFGHYDHPHDTVMVSRTLDRPDVPDFVVDYIMYHELLHKKFGLNYQNGRHEVHTPEFRQAMKRFHHYTEARQFINNLARCKD